MDFVKIFEKTAQGWNIKKEIYDKEGNQVTLESLGEIKRMIDYGRGQTMGHPKFKGTLFNNTYARSLFFFVNYLVPLMQNVLLYNRRDFVNNRVVNNFNLEFLRYIANTCKYLMNFRWYWNYMTTGQKQNLTKALVTYISLYTLVMVLKYLFGFNPKEKDAYKKLKNNHWAENFALITILKTASEIEQQSIVNPLSKTVLPVITANWDAIRNPMLVRLITDLGKTSQLMYETSQYEIGIDDDEDDVFYDKGNKKYGIKKGDMKLLHALNKLHSFKSQTFDFGLQAEIYQQMTNR